MVTGDAEYRPVFDETVNTYYVAWQDDQGRTIDIGR